MTNFSTLREGDRIGTERELHVTGNTKHALYLTDAMSGQDFTIPTNSDQGTLTFWVIERAKREHKVGDVITGAELQDGKWKRGTVVTEGGHAFLLLASGVWQTTDELGDTEIFFSDFDRSDDDLKFTIAHLPTAER